MGCLRLNVAQTPQLDAQMPNMIMKAASQRMRRMISHYEPRERQNGKLHILALFFVFG